MPGSGVWKHKAWFAGERSEGASGLGSRHHLLGCFGGGHAVWRGDHDVGLPAAHAARTTPIPG